MNKKFFVFSISSLLALGIISNAFCHHKVEEADAYSTTSLPTTIDLNDTSEANIRSYYSSLSSLTQSERQGTNLLKNLKTILKNGQKYLSYDSGSAIWQIYEIADRDWDLSPASSTTYGTYNAVTNKITGYSYGTSKANSKNNPYLHALYINRNVDNQVTAWDDHQQTQWGINREHVWPKSHGFGEDGDAKSTGGARGDPMHLMAGNGYANNIHSNYFYGYVNTALSYTNCGTKYANLNNNLLGKSLTLGGSDVFEPQDSDKGDIARAIFYMAARYNYLSGSDSDGIDSNNPNLTILQAAADTNGTGTYISSTYNAGEMGILTDLLAWHHADPVDKFEIHRNNLLYTNYTNNRNPFIDFPEWVDYIWGTATYNGKNLQSYSSTPTGYASPSSDTINGYNGQGGETVAVTGVTLDKTTLKLIEGDNSTLTATVAPANATDKSVTWTSSDNSVATVSNSGVVTAISEGSATIVVRTSNGGFTATCDVTVEETSASGSVTAVGGAFEGWTSSGLGSAYKNGQAKFDSTGDYVEKTNLFSAKDSEYMLTLTVTVNGNLNGTDNASNSYKVEALNSSGTVLSTKTYTGLIGSSYTDKVFTLNTNLSGCTGIRVTYANKASGNWGVASISWSATYNNAITSITASCNIDFYVGEAISKNQISVTSNLGKQVNSFSFADDGYIFTYSDASSGGADTNKQFTVTYEQLEATFTVRVRRKAVIEHSDTLDLAATDISGTSYASWDGVSLSTDAVYAGQSAGGNNSIQLRSKNNNSGIVTTFSDRNVTKVSVTWNNSTAAGRTLNIYGKNTEYSSPADLYSAGTQGTLLGTIVKGTSTELLITGDYMYVGVRSNADALYLTDITFSYQTSDNMANYIMFEDTNNQCLTKYEVAKAYFNELTIVDRATFMTSSNYVIATARNRLAKWAAHEGESIVLSDGDYVIVNSRHTNQIIHFENSGTVIVVISLAVLSITIYGLYFFYKKKNK